MITETDLVIRLIEAAIAADKLGFAVTLESRPRDHIEDGKRAVSVFGRITTALDFDAVDVLGIELRANIGGDAGVRDRHAIEQPRDLMSAANVQLIVDHIRARHIISDHGHAVRLAGAGRGSNLLSVHNGCSSR